MTGFGTGYLVSLLIIVVILTAASFIGYSRERKILKDVHHCFRMGMFWFNRKFYDDKRLVPAYLKLNFWFSPMLMFSAFSLAFLYNYFTNIYDYLPLVIAAFFAVIAIICEIMRRKRLVEFNALKAELEIEHLADKKDILQAKLCILDGTFKYNVMLFILFVIMSIMEFREINFIREVGPIVGINITWRIYIILVMYVFGALSQIWNIIYYKLLEKKQYEDYIMEHKRS
ncbi:MAG: hypothetical protein FWE29_01045 [Defluviitaleaceae bacterium]|nr:hypothetical protein [Defluviitaleaceae bacterium]